MDLLKESIQKLIMPLSQKRGFYYAFLMHNWEKIMGPELAKFTRPFKMTSFQDKPGVLIVETTSSGAMNLSLEKIQLIGQINRYFGVSLVEDIKFQHTFVPLAPEKEKVSETTNSEVVSIEALKQVSEIVENIEDPEMKKIFKRFGLSLHQKSDS